MSSIKIEKITSWFILFFLFLGVVCVVFALHGIYHSINENTKAIRKMYTKEYKDCISWDPNNNHLSLLASACPEK